jgi:hypothetical protein
LQHWVFADGMMRRKEGTKFHARHGKSSRSGLIAIG